MSRTDLQERDNAYMYQFRTKACTKQRCHHPKTCFGTHSRFSLGTRRRVPKQDEHGCFNYIPKHCPEWQKTKYCRLGDSCLRSHGWTEIIFHPLLYKTKRCSSRHENGICKQYGVLCAKAHSAKELRNLVEIYGKDWKRLYDLPRKEKNPDSMSIFESGRKCFKSQKAIDTLPSKMQPSGNSLTDCLLDKPKRVTNLYRDQNQGEGSREVGVYRKELTPNPFPSPLRIPKLASPAFRSQSFENYSSYITSAHLHGIYESIRYDMPELFLDPMETSNGETAEMNECYTDFAIKCKSSVINAPSECSSYSLSSISSLERSSSSSSIFLEWLTIKYPVSWQICGSNKSIFYFLFFYFIIVLPTNTTWRCNTRKWEIRFHLLWFFNSFMTCFRVFVLLRINETSNNIKEN